MIPDLIFITPKGLVTLPSTDCCNDLKVITIFDEDFVFVGNEKTIRTNKDSNINDIYIN
jgi:hypothetical protein